MNSIAVLAVLALFCTVASCRSPVPDESQDPYSMHCVRMNVCGPDGRMHETLALVMRLTPEESAACEAEKVRDAGK
ncbi:MAG: hypothetical protein IPJ19_11005 [Planctomycetes bacterium]|nr:hypothetical protein [Planctomycetota bacterium]